MSETKTENMETNEDTGSSQTQETTFTQAEMDKIIQQRLDRVNKKYANVDIEKYHNLVNAEEAKELDAQKARGEFDEILQNTVAKKDDVIDSLNNGLRNVKINGALLSSASTKNAVNPNQVVQLLTSFVSLNEGNVEILDTNQKVRYTEEGKPMSPDDLVQEFLQSNPHFVNAGPRGSGSENVAGNNIHDMDYRKLDMKKASDRALFKEHQSKTGKV